jgi:hypothetical protein
VNARFGVKPEGGRRDPLGPAFCESDGGHRREVDGRRPLFEVAWQHCERAEEARLQPPFVRPRTSSVRSRISPVRLLKPFLCPHALSVRPRTSLVRPQNRPAPLHLARTASELIRTAPKAACTASNSFVRPQKPAYTAHPSGIPAGTEGREGRFWSLAAHTKEGGQCPAAHGIRRERRSESCSRAPCR